MREIRVPDSLAQYHERAMSVLRYQFGPAPFGPTARLFTSYSPQQRKFLCDIAHAFHNFADEGGVEFFYEEAVQINAAWKDHHTELADGNPYDHFFQKLWPLPEKPGAPDTTSPRSATTHELTNAEPLPLPRDETPIDEPLRLAETDAPFRGARPDRRR